MMPDTTVSNSAPGAVPMAADPVHTAQKQAPADPWPHSPPIFAFAIGGVAMLVVAVVGRVLRTMGVPKDVVLTLVACGSAAGVVAVIVYAVSALRRRRRRNAVGLSASDPASRLRVYGPEAKVKPIADEVENVAFEPVIMRSIHGVEFGREAAGALVTKKSKRRGLLAKTSSSPDFKVHHTTFWSIALGIGTVVGLHFLVFQFSRKDPPNYFEVMAGVALGLCISSFIRPVYVRLAPGVMDVLLFGVLGSGTPRVERYDLRTARVTVDAERRRVCIEDPTRAGARTIFLYTGRLLGGPAPRERAVLLAARSTHPTPPMPSDALE